MVPLLSLLPQELDKNFLPVLAVAYDILAFILPNRVLGGGFVWGRFEPSQEGLLSLKPSALGFA